MLTITDTVRDLAGNPIPHASVTVLPSILPLTVTPSGGSAQFRIGSSYPIMADATGSITIPVPSLSECSPNTGLTFTLLFGDGTKLSGAPNTSGNVTTTFAGLETTYNWSATGGTPSQASPDATTTTVGDVLIDQAPASGHPVAVTTPRIGAASGVASLDGSGHVPLAQLFGIGPSQLSLPKLTITPQASTGAPTTGTWGLGDVILDNTERIWICTTAGTPGTWRGPI